MTLAWNDADGFVCDGEWIPREGPGSGAERHWEALEEWQAELDSRITIVPVEKVELDGLVHGGGSPPPGGGWWRWRRRSRV